MKNEICVWCEKPGAEFAARCGHFYHIKCYERRAYGRGIMICEVDQCDKPLSLHYEVEEMLCKIKLLDLNLPENKKLYELLKDFAIGYKTTYDSDILLKLVKLGWNINTQMFGGPYQFFQASMDNDIEKMDLLIDFGMDIDKYGSGALKSAILNASFDAFEKLLKLGVQLETKFFIDFIENRYLDVKKCIKMMKLLIKEGVDVNYEYSNGYRPIHAAARLGELQTIKVLIENGADCNVVDHNGNSIFHYASVNFDADKIFAFFRGSGFDINRQNKNGVTPFMLAIQERKCSSQIKNLLREKMNLNIADLNGNTPLHYSVENCNSDVTAMLIKKGADVNSKNNEGKTPLHSVLCTDFVRTVNLLLDKGANVNVLDNSGNSPLYYLFRSNMDRGLKQKFINSGADLKIKREYYTRTILEEIEKSEDADLLIKSRKRRHASKTI